MIMKTKLMFMMTVVLVSLSSCKVNIGNGGEWIEPSNNIVKAKYPQESFDKVESQVVGDIQLVQSQKGNSRVTLSAPENYIDLFEIKNDDGKLNIKYAEGDFNIDGRNVTIIVYTPTLSQIKNSGAADIRLDSLTTDELDVRNSGVGTFNLSNIKAKRVDVSCSGVGSITLSGQAEDAEYDCSGVGSINAKDLKASDVKASVSGVGGIECYASEYIKGRVSGVGGLKYAGHPTKKELDHNMTGSISEM
mgnify:CR=1 FL=1